MILDYRNIDIYQDDHCVLENVNMQLHEGDLVYLTGAVGSGKTSLMKTIYGELPCEGEKADVLGFDMRKIHSRQLPDLRRQLGIVFQDFKLLPDRNIRKNLDFVLSCTGWTDKKKRKNRIQEVMEMVGMEDVLNKYIFEVSGGEKQRISIARAILNFPKLILADEPTGNLDDDNGERIMSLLDKIRRENNSTIILSTHNMKWLDAFPGQVYTIRNGELLFEENEYIQDKEI